MNDSKMLKEFERRKIDIIFLKKSVDAFEAAQNALIKIIEMRKSAIVDEQVLEALFYYFVVKYVSPFMATNVSKIKMNFPRSILKKTDGYVEGVHELLLQLRKEAVGHEDNDFIAADFKNHWCADVPIQYGLINRRVLFWSDMQDLDIVLRHTSAVLNSARQYFMDRIHSFTKFQMENRENLLNSPKMKVIEKFDLADGEIKGTNYMEEALSQHYRDRDVKIEGNLRFLENVTYISIEHHQPIQVAEDHYVISEGNTLVSINKDAAEKLMRRA